MSDVFILDAGVRDVMAAYERGLDDLAAYTAAEWKRTAPVGDPATDPHSGRYRDSIRATRDAAGARVVADAEEWLFLEFGTVNMGAQPSALPAFAVAMSHFDAIVNARAAKELNG